MDITGRLTITYFMYILTHSVKHLALAQHRIQIFQIGNSLYLQKKVITWELSMAISNPTVGCYIPLIAINASGHTHQVDALPIMTMVCLYCI